MIIPIAMIQDARTTAMDVVAEDTFAMTIALIIDTREH
jgi:hypothetical protein